MGTTSSDTAYLGLAHVAAHPPLSLKQLRSIDARWLEWEPLCISKAREQPDHASAMFLYKATHRSRIIQLLSVHRFRWKTIRLHQMDCPTDSSEDFALKIKMVIKRPKRNAIKKEK